MQIVSVAQPTVDVLEDRYRSRTGVSAGVGQPMRLQTDGAVGKRARRIGWTDEWCKASRVGTDSPPQRRLLAPRGRPTEAIEGTALARLESLTTGDRGRA